MNFQDNPSNSHRDIKVQNLTLGHHTGTDNGSHAPIYNLLEKGDDHHVTFWAFFGKYIFFLFSNVSKNKVIVDNDVL